MIYTTLNNIRAHKPCKESWKELLVGLDKTEPDDEPLPLVRILEINGIDDAVWALCSADCDREAQLFAIACARQVQHLMTDQRSIDAVDVAERFLNGCATNKEVSSAVWAAWEAASYVANFPEFPASAPFAAKSAVWAATSVGDIPKHSVWDTSDAVRNALNNATLASVGTLREKQAEIFKQIFGGE